MFAVGLVGAEKWLPQQEVAQVEFRFQSHALSNVSILILRPASTGGSVLSVPFPINKIGEQSLCVWAVGAGFFLRRSWMYLYPWTPSTFGRQFAGFELCYLAELLWLFARPVHVILSFFGLSRLA